MRVAILGGGFTGLTAAYFLKKKDRDVSVFEKEKTLGGLAEGFYAPGWEWALEKTYHHIFSGDTELLSFAKKLNYKNIFFRSPETTSFINSRTFPVDTPQDFLMLPNLNLLDKLRAGAIVAFIKISPFFSFYEKQTAEKFLKFTMGDRAWKELWEGLFRKKFGKYAENILASFFWARIKKRTKKLGYVRGGFQNLIDYLENFLIKSNVKIHKGREVLEIKKNKKGLSVYFKTNAGEQLKEEFDAIISTVPTPITAKITTDLFTSTYIYKLKSLKYLSAVNLILETNNPLVEKTYWINVLDNKIPAMCVVQHTNFIEKEQYGGKHILYIANYLEPGDKLINMKAEDMLSYYLPGLKKINPFFNVKDAKLYKFTFDYAQPIFDKNFIQNKPVFNTPIKNFYLANLDMTYPYDRGVNFAVKLGREVASLI